MSTWIQMSDNPDVWYEVDETPDEIVEFLAGSDNSQRHFLRLTTLGGKHVYVNVDQIISFGEDS